eukprot:768349-Hanusia_phi.AAC.1
MQMSRTGSCLLLAVFYVQVHSYSASQNDVLVDFHGHQVHLGCSCELLLAAPIIRGLSFKHTAVFVAMDESTVESFDYLFGDLRNVRPVLLQDKSSASSLLPHVEQVVIVPAIVLDATSLRLVSPAASLDLGMSCTDAVYLGLGGEYSERWDRWHINRVEERERGLFELLGIASDETYIISSPWLDFSLCRERNLSQAGMRCIDVSSHLSSLTSIFHLAGVLERAEELHLGYGTLAFFADHLDLSNVGKKVIYMFGLDDNIMRDFKLDWIFAQHETTITSNHLVQFNSIECNSVSSALSSALTWKCDLDFAVEPWQTANQLSQITVQGFSGSKMLTRAQLTLDPWAQEQFPGGCSFLVNQQRWQGCVVSLTFTARDFLTNQDVELEISGTVGMKREQSLVISKKLFISDVAEQEGSVKENTVVVVFSSCSSGGECIDNFRRLFVHLQSATRVDWIVPQHVKEEDFNECLASVQSFSRVTVYRMQNSFDFWSGYVIMMDDQLSYPEDYVEKMKALIDKYERRAMIGLQGVSLNQALHGNSDQNCSSVAPEYKEVDVLRLGTIGFHTSVCYRDLLFKIRSVRDLFNSLGDVQILLSWTSHVCGIPRVQVDHDALQSLTDFSVEETDLFRTISRDFLPMSRLPLVVNAESQDWRLHEGRWQQWLQEAFNNSAKSMMKLNFQSMTESVHELEEETAISDRLASIPVVVMNQRHDELRLRHVMQTLQQIGLRNLSVPPTMSWDELDLDSLVRSGRVSSNLLLRLDWYKDGDLEAKMKYLANAYEQIRIIQQAADGEYPLLVFEDDIVPISQDLRHVQVMLAEALSQAPPSADMIYLEFCYETCANVTYSQSRPLLARAFAPSCSAAIFYTIKGARRISQLCVPVFDVIDRMYQFLIQTRLLEAYLSLPPIFVQDKFWKSNVKKLAGSSLHAPLQPPCGGFEAARLFREAELKQEGLLLSPASAASFARSRQPPTSCRPLSSEWKTGSVRYIFFAQLLEIEEEMSRADKALVYSEEEDKLDVFLGAFIPGQKHLLLFAGEASSCFAKRNHWSCVLRLFARASDGTVTKHQKKRIFLRACS